MEGIEPSPKAPELTDFLEAMAGRTTAIRGGRCVKKPFGCERLVELLVWPNVAVGDKYYDDHPMPFRDGNSINEYRISGLCQKCQDDTFDADPFEDDDPGSEWRDPEPGSHIGRASLGETDAQDPPPSGPR